MAIWQAPRFLSMIALGTNGGQPRADGSKLEPQRQHAAGSGPTEINA
jgi:hypothetical protein